MQHFLSSRDQLFQKSFQCLRGEKPKKGSVQVHFDKLFRYYLLRWGGFLTQSAVVIFSFSSGKVEVKLSGPKRLGLTSSFLVWDTPILKIPAHLKASCSLCMRLDKSFVFLSLSMLCLALAGITALLWFLWNVNGKGEFILSEQMVGILFKGTRVAGQDDKWPFWSRINNVTFVFCGLS